MGNKQENKREPNIVVSNSNNFDHYLLEDKKNELIDLPERLVTEENPHNDIKMFEDIGKNYNSIPEHRNLVYIE